MTARSTGIFPRKAGWVDEATLLPADGSNLAVPNLRHYGEVYFLAFFSADAVGSVVIEKADGTDLVTITAPAGGGRRLLMRDGFEIGQLFGDVETIKLNDAGLTAGTVQVSVF